MLAGATIATLATFVPCFVFIITGAPLIDRVRHTGAFANALNGVTIAVVGVIAALAVFVARHAAVPDGDPDWLVIATAAIAFVGRLALPRRRGHHRDRLRGRWPGGEPGVLAPGDVEHG